MELGHRFMVKFQTPTKIQADFHVFSEFEQDS